MLRVLLLAPGLVLLLASVLVPQAAGPTWKNLFLWGHIVLVVGGAIITGLYARSVGFEVAKWVVAAVFFPYVTPAILFFMRVRDPKVDEFGALFQEFSLAEAERALARGRTMDPAAITRAATERSAAVLMAKYRMTPQEVARVVESFARSAAR